MGRNVIGGLYQLKPVPMMVCDVGEAGRQLGS